MFTPRHVVFIKCLTAAVCLSPFVASGASPVVVAGLSGFEGMEEPTVIYFPDTNTFQNDSYINMVDEGGGMIRSTLRNNYSTLGWWDGDRATTNTDRQRAEVKGITGLGHQKVDQTFEYSFDFRTDADFTATGHFCHVFQLKATDGNDGPPLVTVSLYKNGNAIQGRLLCNSDGSTSTGTPRTFTYTAGEWCHVVVRIATCASTESAGAVLASINGDAFQGITNQSVYLSGSTDYRPKWGLYRGIGLDYGVPVGDSWVEHRTVTGYIGTSNLLNWNGGLNGNTWDNNTTQNFLNGASATTFNIDDQINFTDASANTAVTIAGNVAPNYTRINSAQNYSFSGTGSITGGTLRKDGSGMLTLATTNSYPGLTDVRSGVLFVTGSLGNNSLVSLAGGTLRAGSSTALGSNSTVGTQIDGGTLDINGFNLSTEPISVRGAGVSGNGTIVNGGASQTSALTNVTLTGDTTLGGSGRWDIRGTGATLGTGGNSYNLTKTGANQISFVAANVDAALANININQGILAFQASTTSMGDPTKTVTIAPGAILGFYNTANVMTKLCNLNGGTLWAESGSGNQNTFSGAISVSNAGGVFDAGGALTGGTPKSSAILNLSGPTSGTGRITKNGPGTVVISGTANTWSGGTIINGGALTVNGAIPGPVTVNATAILQGVGSVTGLVTIAGGGTLSPGNSPGNLAVGSLSLSSGSQTNIELGGITRGSQYDAVISNGNVSLAGTLNVSLINGFTPAPGGDTSFDILDWDALSGKFSTVQLPSLTAPMDWNLSQLYATGVITATPYMPGDFNRDGHVTVADVEAMMTAVSDLSGYQSKNKLTTPQLLTIGDLDNSGSITNADIQSLISLLANNARSGGGSLTAVPEPTSCILASIALMAALCGRWVHAKRMN